LISIITEKIHLTEILEFSKENPEALIKAVVDIDKKIMAIGGDLHADEEVTLLEYGSLQQSLWGINLYPDKAADEWIEFDSMINIRPRQNNRSRDVEDPEIRKKIYQIVNNLIIRS
jgi:hypothetical protein